MRFLLKEPLIAMCDYTTSVGHTVERPKVHETVLNSKRTRAKIVKGITSKVIKLTTEEGVHPGAELIFGATSATGGRVKFLSAV